MFTDGTSDTQQSTFDSSNSVTLSAQKDSKIINVSVYTGRAEITREFKLTLNAGHNQVTISDLPNTLDHESFRVEGKGDAVIQDVTLATVTPQPEPASLIAPTSPELERLEMEHIEISKSLARATNSLRFLEEYLKNAAARELASSDLSAITASYEAQAAILDTKIIKLEIEKARIWNQGEQERRRLSGPTPVLAKPSLQVVIGVIADGEKEIQLALIYASKGVFEMSWAPAYDVLIDTKSNEGPIVVKYKAIIKQQTSEDWIDVPITLETATPTFGAAIPKLRDWKLTIPPPPVAQALLFGVPQASNTPVFGAAQPSGGFFGAQNLNAEEMRLRAASFANSSAQEAFRSQESEVSAEGKINASYKVPGLLTIRTGPIAHSVTIAKLSLDATLQWIAVPKADIHVHIKANIKNTSQYILLQGPANVYMDGSFVARTTIPRTHPDQSFDCSLGLDNSVRVTYHPLDKIVVDKGFFSKSTTQRFSRRITIQNHKATPIDGVQIFDHIPVSENGAITVKLATPALQIPEFGATVAPAPIKVGEGVVALWGSPDSDEAQGLSDGTLGKDGKLQWKCALPAQGKVDLTLQWEVSGPLGTNILGL